MINVFQKIGSLFRKEEKNIEKRDYNNNYSFSFKDMKSSNLYSNLATANACISLIAKTVSSLPIKIYNRKNKVISDNENLKKIFSLKPNSFQTITIFLDSLVRNALINGNIFFYIQKNVAGQLIGFIPLNSNGVKVLFNNMEKYFQIGDKIFTANDILHIPFNSVDGITGISTISAYENLFITANKIETFTKNFFRNSAVPSGVLTTDKEIDEDTLERLRFQMEKFRSEEKAFQMFIFEDGLKYTPISFNARDTQLLEIKKYTNSEISKAFGVPENLLGGEALGDYEATLTNFHTNTILPFLKIIETAFNEVLWNDGIYIEFLMNNFMRAKTSERISSIISAISGGLLTVNEGRSFENLPPVEGGDKVLIPVNNLNTLQSLEEPVKIKNEKEKLDEK